MLTPHTLTEADLEHYRSEFMFSPDHGTRLTIAIFGAPEGATAEAITAALTLEGMRCSHNHDCCGCTVRRGVRLLVPSEAACTWFAVLETQTNV